MAENFHTLVGAFIHQCGTIEFLLNNTIKAYSKDSILASSTIRSPLSKRILIFQELLRRDSDIEPHLIDKLCKEIDELRIKRNVVAHNPIVSKKHGDLMDGEILALRHTDSGILIPSKITRNQISEMILKSNSIISDITRLIPESKNC